MSSLIFENSCLERSHKNFGYNLFMLRSHKIQLIPNQKAVEYFRQACGCARLAWNVALAKWKEGYQNGDRPSGSGLKVWFNSIKREQYPFVYAVTKCATERPFTNLQNAFNRFFSKQGGHPKFKSRHRSRDSFYVSNDKFSVSGKYIRIPRLGVVRMTEKLRYQGKIFGATISRTADRWFVSIQVEVESPIGSDALRKPSVGIDLGIKSFAVLSDGTSIDNPRIFKRFEAKLRRLNKSLSRKVKGSSNWKKTKAKLARLHYRIACCRLDFVHKFTHFIAQNYSTVCLEDLNVAGMLRNHKLAKHIQDISLFEVRRQLEYKCNEVHFVSRFDATSKTCSCCDWKNENLALEDRVFECSSCGLVEDRDLNASKNILRWASPKVKPVDQKALARNVKSRVKPSGMKQELGVG